MDATRPAWWAGRRKGVAAQETNSIWLAGAGTNSRVLAVELRVAGDRFPSSAGKRTARLGGRGRLEWKWVTSLPLRAAGCGQITRHAARPDAVPLTGIAALPVEEPVRRSAIIPVGSVPRVARRIPSVSDAGCVGHRRVRSSVRFRRGVGRA